MRRKHILITRLNNGMFAIDLKNQHGAQLLGPYLADRGSAARLLAEERAFLFRIKGRGARLPIVDRTA